MSKRKAAPAGITVGTGLSLEVLKTQRAGQEYARVLVAEVIPDPTQPRKTFDRKTLLELAASLLEQGQLQPIRVRPWGEADGQAEMPTITTPRYVLIAGERRWRAAQLANVSELDAIVDYEVAPERSDGRRQTLLQQLAENLQRDDRPRGDAAAALLELQRLGVKRDDIARVVHRSTEWVDLLLTFARVDADARRIMDERGISTQVARMLPTLSPTEQRAVVNALPDGTRESHIAALQRLSAYQAAGEVFEDALDLALDGQRRPSDRLEHGSTQRPSEHPRRPPVPVLTAWRAGEVAGLGPVLRCAPGRLPFGRLPRRATPADFSDAVIEAVADWRDSTLRYLGVEAWVSEAAALEARLVEVLRDEGDGQGVGKPS